jgi:hypothetical protein
MSMRFGITRVGVLHAWTETVVAAVFGPVCELFAVAVCVVFPMALNGRENRHVYDAPAANELGRAGQSLFVGREPLLSLRENPVAGRPPSFETVIRNHIVTVGTCVFRNDVHEVALPKLGPAPLPPSR